MVVLPEIQRVPMQILGPSSRVELVSDTALDVSQPRTWIELVAAKVQAQAQCLPGHFTAVQGAQGVWGDVDFVGGVEDPLVMSDFWFDGSYRFEGQCEGNGSATVTDLRALTIPFLGSQIQVAEQSGSTENFSAGGFQSILSLNASPGKNIVLMTLEFRSATPQSAAFRLKTSSQTYQPIGSTRTARSEWRMQALLTELSGTNIELQLQGGVFGNPVMVRQIRLYAIPTSGFEVAQVTQQVNPTALQSETVIIAKPGRYVSIQMLHVEGTGYQVSLLNPSGSASLYRAQTDPVDSLTLTLPELIDVSQSTGTPVQFQTGVIALDPAATRTEVSRLLIGPFDDPILTGDAGPGTIDAGTSSSDAGSLFDAGVSAVDGGTGSVPNDAGMIPVADASETVLDDAGGSSRVEQEMLYPSAGNDGDAGPVKTKPTALDYTVHCGCNGGHGPLAVAFFLLIGFIRARRRRA